MQVHDFLLHSAERDADAPFIWDQGIYHTYEEIALRSQRLAHYLSCEIGLPRGSRVCLYWENSVSAVVASFGVWLAGCVLVSIDTEIHGEDLAYQIGHSDASVLVAGYRQIRHLSEIDALPLGLKALVVEDGAPLSERLSLPVMRWSATVETGEQLVSPVRTVDIDLAAIIYTSGSTGVPKGVMLTHLNLVSNMRSIVSYLGLTAADRVMMILPHFYIYGLSLILSHALVGGSVVLDNSFVYPNTVLDNMVRTAVTGFAGVPSTFSVLLSRSKLRNVGVPSLRYVTQAGGAMPPRLQQEVAEAFAPARLFIMYGSTEAAPRLSYLDPEDLPHKWGSIGKPIPNVDLFVADSDGRPLPPLTEGELVARGSNITPGYWKDPAATAEVLRNGLYFTGDLGFEDEEGFLFITGRAKDVIKVKGFRVSPKEIEGHLVGFDGIEEAAVIGVTDELLGEAPVAFLVSAQEASVNEQGLRAFLRSRLADYKMPREFVFVASLPKTAAGKVKKRCLKEQMQRQLEE